ncbi:MAG: substrate-binding domain-containing protein [Eubacteriales bacterium]|nr:substrate-binding domain-containing protein [Eubacteriales bacterium]
MKKLNRIIISLVLGIIMAIGLSGCGGADNEITVVSREDGSGTRGAFVELMGILEKDADGNKKDLTTDEAVIANKTDVMLANIEGDPYSIGYVSLGSLNDSVKSVTVDGVQAKSENIKNGSYPVARPFNIATKGMPSELARDFISFILSVEGQDIIADKYISIDDNAKAFSSTNPGGKLVIAGSSSVFPVMEKLVEEYRLLNSDADIEIQSSDSTAGMSGVIEGTCDIGMASRALTESELNSLVPTEIAMDGIAVIVNKANPIENLTSDQIKAIFTGTTVTWDTL